MKTIKNNVENKKKIPKIQEVIEEEEDQHEGESMVIVNSRKQISDFFLLIKKYIYFTRDTSYSNIFRVQNPNPVKLEDF